MAGKDIHVVIANRLYDAGLSTLNKVVDTTISVKLTDAMRYFEAAAEEFKALSMWRKSADAYSRCAECENRLGHRLACATYYYDAAECMSRTDPTESVRYFNRALAILASLGRFVAAAAIQREVAGIHEASHALSEAATSLSNAADYYIGEAMPHPALFCLTRAADHYVEDERYSDAAKRLLQALSLCLEDNLLKFNAPSIALTTALCFLALRDDTKALEFLEEHAAKDLLFVVSREKRFLLDVILAAQERLPDELMDHVWNFDYVCELSPTQLRLLQEVYLAVKEAKEDDERHGEESSTSENSWEESDEDEDEFDEEDEDDEEGADTRRPDDASSMGTSTARTE